MKPLKTIGIIAAIESEADEIAKQFENLTESEFASNPTWEGDFGGKRIVITRAGMGTNAAAAATQYLISNFGAEAVIFSGIAGNLNPNLRLGDIVLAEEIIALDTDSNLIAEYHPFLAQLKSDPELLKVAETVGKQILPEGTQIIVGKKATGNFFVNTDEEIAEVKRQAESRGVEVDCVAMEGVAVLQIAAKNQVPALVIRAMSDDCNEDYDEFSKKQFSLAEYAATASKLVLGIISAL